MSVELISVLIAMLAVGATLGGLILTGNRGLRQDMHGGVHYWRTEKNDGVVIEGTRQRTNFKRA